MRTLRLRLLGLDLAADTPVFDVLQPLRLLEVNKPRILEHPLHLRNVDLLRVVFDHGRSAQARAQVFCASSLRRRVERGLEYLRAQFCQRQES